MAKLANLFCFVIVVLLYFARKEENIYKKEGNDIKK